MKRALVGLAERETERDRETERQRETETDIERQREPEAENGPIEVRKNTSIEILKVYSRLHRNNEAYLKK